MGIIKNISLLKSKISKKIVQCLQNLAFLVILVFQMFCFKPYVEGLDDLLFYSKWCNVFLSLKRIY